MIENKIVCLECNKTYRTTQSPLVLEITREDYYEMINIFEEKAKKEMKKEKRTSLCNLEIKLH